MKISQESLDEITRRLVDIYHPERIVLFGSQAWGDPHADSDVDLLVVVAESSEPGWRRARAAYRGLFGLGIPCDVLVRTRHEVAEEQKAQASLVRRIMREGRTLHG
ncbi:MAG: nucleotidyltransferase domain-containing protein [Betaproteobacteria bacterium]|nr:nucleotidyltransferase domain-containing protein [Betaproteobacteria bacterium]